MSEMPRARTTLLLWSPVSYDSAPIFLVFDLQSSNLWEWEDMHKHTRCLVVVGEQHATRLRNTVSLGIRILQVRPVRRQPWIRAADCLSACRFVQP